MNPRAGNGALQDSLVISLVVVLSAAFYVGYLGFYSDDWAFFEGLVLGGPDRTFPALLKDALWANSIWTRPVHALYATGLFWLFGLDPLGYHLVNLGVILAGVLLFYLALRELGLGRPMALSISLLYALLPHYSTDRFFYMIFQAPMSMGTYFLSLYADLRADGRPSGRRWAWRVLAVSGLLVSILSYEVFLPLFFLNPFLVWYRRWQVTGRWTVSWLPALLYNGLRVALIVGISIFKALTTLRMQPASAGDHLLWFGRFLAKAVYTLLLGDFGLRLPLVLVDILRNHAMGPILAAGGIAGFIIFTQLHWSAREPGDAIPGRQELRRLLGCGGVLFVAGYSIFLFSFTADISSTGMDNRTAIAAAVGIAVALVAGIGLICSWIPSPRWRNRLFAGLVALACASGFIVINTLAMFWGAAAMEQRTVLDSIRRNLPAIAPGSTLILDGACPYVGPAPVFEAFWDMTGAVRLLYRDTTLTADVVTPRLRIADDGLHTSIYEDPHGPYRYDQLLVYDLPRQTTSPLTGPDIAREYFRSANPTLTSGCRPSQGGSGERVFVPGARRARFPPSVD